MAKRQCDPTSGSIGQETYLISRNGQVVRTRAIPANPNTPAQSTVRVSLAAQAQAWRGLTAAQRLAWASVAATVQSKPRLGMSGPLTGEQLFCKINAALVAFGQAAVTDPPALPEFPTLAPQGLVATNTGGVIALKLTCPTDPGDTTIVRGAAPVSAGIARLPRVAVLGMCPAPVGGASDITALYTAKYGAPEAGKKVFVTVNQMVDGWQDVQRVFSAIVPTGA